MSNGKGSRPRNNHSEAFRANYDAIQWKPLGEAGKPEDLTSFVTILPDIPDEYAWCVKKRSKKPTKYKEWQSGTAKASKRAKSQGNSLSEAITASQTNPK